MRKKRQFKAGRCYHLVSRIAHRAFFFDEEEKNRFAELLMRSNAVAAKLLTNIEGQQLNTNGKTYETTTCSWCDGTGQVWESE